MTNLPINCGEIREFFSFFRSHWIVTLKDSRAENPSGNWGRILNGELEDLMADKNRFSLGIEDKCDATRGTPENGR